ncbi:CdaR family transcriptional regulator [Paenibacillus sp. MSJ-34]|uniref:PucR family transcriptional regulator n=1 Tax=Paenibacillus sp. MSJ-34 TaxID=2841529 RepID=UPI001C11CBDE|nr:helix-turn-helix domain-containing protein [Paenibacillus sp. MSJ-34]MBU5445295.1 helix-turn-helix domain-containing protein [Paenibacillus sp. MSJ-34]
MRMDKIKQRLERILHSPMTVEKFTANEWIRLFGENGQASGEGQSLDLADRVVFLWKREGNAVEAISVEKKLTDSERELIELLLQSVRPASKLAATVSDEERKALQLGEWINQQIDHGAPYEAIPVPDQIALKSRLRSKMIPLLLVLESSQSQRTPYGELFKLLKTYFGGEVLLIPLHDKEWLILCPEEMVFGAAPDEDRTDEGAEGPEDTVASFCRGLYELLASEWAGECRLSIDTSIDPELDLVAATTLLRETVFLGRLFHVTENIHMPWQLDLERLVYSIPDETRSAFVEKAMQNTDIFSDAETFTTLETFFQLDCNVSDTAKKLYIHRNTLLYRLDKFKQETGLDVRTFGDAVLVKLTLLLYKVTKRK